MRCTFRAGPEADRRPENRPFWHIPVRLRRPSTVNAACRTLRESRRGPGPSARRLPALLWAVCLLALPAVASGQEDATPDREEREAPLPPQEDDQPSAGEDDLPPGREERLPPGDHPSDVYDVLSVPLKVAAAPLILAGHTLRLLLRVALPSEPERGAPRVTAVLRGLNEAGYRAELPSLGARAGPALGIRVEPHGPLFVESALSWRLYQRHAAGVELRDPSRGEGERLTLAWRRERQPHFWGVGARTRPDDRADFRWDQAQLGAEVGRLVPGGAVWIGVAAEHNWTGSGRDDGVPDLTDHPESGALFGLAEPYRYLRASAAARLDGVRWRALQPRGVELEATGTLYRGIVDTPSDFARLQLRAAGHLPVSSHQQLALFTGLESTLPLGGGGVPFTHLASLGGGVGGRAYEAGRFRDRALLTGTVEWRWELWRTIHDDVRVEAFLFVEAGTVARAPGALSAGDLRGSWGAGLRGVDAMGLRALGFLAFGAEGTRVGGALQWPH